MVDSGSTKNMDLMGSVTLVMGFKGSFGLVMVDVGQYLKFQTESVVVLKSLDQMGSV